MANTTPRWKGLLREQSFNRESFGFADRIVLIALIGIEIVSMCFFLL